MEEEFSNSVMKLKEEIETTLSNYNSKTCNYKLHNHSEQRLFRKLKLIK